jgi:hypothetical protein
MHPTIKRVNDIRSPKLFMGSSLLLGLVSLIFNIIGFSTPNWLQLWPRVGDSTFRNLGLWQVCIAGFRNPKDMWGKVSYGCWWIFAREYNRLREDGILLPPWFQAVQTMACFSFIVNSFAVIFLVIAATTNFRTSVRFIRWTAALCFLNTIFGLIALLIFGIYADMGLKWMPRREYTFLSWSYIFEVFCNLFTLIAGVLMVCEAHFIKQAKEYYNSHSTRSSVKSMLA